jgi:O-antigen/teichoic acid export membrane protein
MSNVVVRITDPRPEALKASFLKASKWAALAEISAKVLTPLFFLILARLLSPGDFGISAIGVMAVTVSQLIWDAGLSRALIQREAFSESTGNVVFWSNVSLAGLAYAFIFLFAPIISEFFRDPRIGSVLRVQGIHLIIASFGAVHRAVFQRTFDYRALFYVRLAGAVVPAAISIPLAVQGFGYWSLVSGTLGGAITEMLLCWKQSPWRPQLRYDVRLAKTLFSFGLWTTAEAALFMFFAWIDALVVGRHLGAEVLGLYHAGNSLVLALFALTLSPVVPLLFGLFSRLQNQGKSLVNAYLKVLKTIALICVPMAVFIWSFRREIAGSIFGTRWNGVEVVIGIMGLAHGISWLAGANAELYRAVGRPDVTVKIGLFCLAFYLPGYVVAIQYGFATFLATRLLFSGLSLMLHLLVAKRMLSVKTGTFWMAIRWPTVGAAVLAAILLTAQSLLSRELPMIQRVLALVSCSVLPIGLIIWMERDFIKSIVTDFTTQRVIPTVLI